MGIGYDYLPWNRRLLLDLQFGEGIGTLAQDYAKPHHPFTLNGPPTWRQTTNDLNCLDFNPATPDFLDCPDVSSADLRFTTHVFTLATWLYLDSTDFRYLLCKGLTDTDGWEWAVTSDSELWLRTNQAGAHQDTTSVTGAVPLTTWTFVATVRNGASVVHYVNGNASLGTAGTHVNPVAAARKVHVGINDAESAGFWDGILWRPRVWSGALEAATITLLFEHERGLFGV